MRTDYVYENVYDDQEDVSEISKKYGFLAIPVVDKEQRLVGIITVDDILDVMEEEATEDIERMNGVIDWENSDKGYLDMSVWQHVINRLPWLVILMIAYIFTGMIITSFEGRLSQIISLVAYMPMLMGTGGNTGSQAATLIIRGLATDEVDTSDVFKILWKEVRIGFFDRGDSQRAELCQGLLAGRAERYDRFDCLHGYAGHRHLCKDHRQYDTALCQETETGPGADCKSGHIFCFRYGSPVHLFLQWPCCFWGYN